MAERDPSDEREEGGEPRADRGDAGRADAGRGGRFRRLGRRILGEVDPGAADRGERGERSIIGDAKEVFGAVLEGGDKAKSEVVRAVAREVRNYLDELGLKDDIHNLLTNYSFEIHASVNLRKLAEYEKAPREPGESRTGKRQEKRDAKREEAKREEAKREEAKREEAKREPQVEEEEG